MTSPVDSTFDPFSGPSTGSWDHLLKAFRALGGFVENIRTPEDPGAGGLFPVDHAEQVVLRVPDNLLYANGDIEFVDGRIRVKSFATVGDAERMFFESYANSMSWGSGGRRDAMKFIAGLDTLPSGVADLLKDSFGMGEFFDGDREERIQRGYLRARLKNWNSRLFLIPFVELAKHGAAGLPYRADARGCLRIEGKVQDEVLINHGVPDAFGLFLSSGSAIRQPRAYSFPAETKLGGRMLAIRRNVASRVRRGDFQVPVTRSEADQIIFSHLMIGNDRLPRLSRGIFTTLLREAGEPDANEAFDSILYANRKRFLDLLAALEPHEGPMITSLRRVARYQLEAMTNCVGERDI